MRHKIMLIGFLIGMVILTQTACSKKAEDSGSSSNGAVNDTNAAVAEEETSSTEGSSVTVIPAKEENTADTDAMTEFNTQFSGTDVKIPDVIAFIKNNIAAVSPENASAMLLRLEELQVKGLSALEAKYEKEPVQSSFLNAYQTGIDLSKIDEVKDTALKDLLQETVDSGYKQEQAEGFYFPVIDYSVYKQFNSYATPDIKDYMNIMAVESDQAFAKDGALMIGWKDVIDRALSQEAFLNIYGDSVKSDAVKKLYQQYETIAFYGLDNTPLFAYDTKTMNEEAKTAYEEFLNGDVKSDFLNKLKEFMDIVGVSNYQLTDEVEQSRKNILADTTTQTQEGSQVTGTKENRYYVAGIDNPAEFEEAFQLLQQLVKDGNKEKVAEYIAYPFTTKIDGTKKTIKDEKEFVENYDSIMTEKVKNAFINQKVEDTFVNDMGVMVGQGEIWISRILDQKHPYSIYGINN